jgi:hypothetical protein
MRVVMRKSAPSPSSENSDKDPLPRKLRLILLSRIKEAKTTEDRERAENELEKFDAGGS